MKVGINYWFGYPSYPQERIALIKEAGFSNVSLHWTNEYEDVTGDKYEVAQQLEKNGIEISSLHLSYEKSQLLWNPFGEGQYYREQVKLAISEANSLGVSIVVMHSDGDITDAVDIKCYLEPLFECADINGIKLCLENLQHEDNLSRIMRVNEFKNIPLCYDFGHANIRKSPFDCENNSNIRYIHIHDNDGKIDLHELPFEGSMNWNENLSILSKYTNIPRILEIHGAIGKREEAIQYLGRAKDVADYLDSAL